MTVTIGRRELLVALGGAAAAWPLAARAQQPQKIYRSGLLVNDPTIPAQPAGQAFLDGLRETGFIEGKNIVIERRFAEGMLDRYPLFAAELVRLDVDAIAVSSNSAVVAAKQATKTIPIVMINGVDPVAQGIVTSLARPGGNITGLTQDDSARLAAKRMQLLKDAIPQASKIGVLTNPDLTYDQAQWQQLKLTAQSLDVTLRLIAVRHASEFEDAFAEISGDRPDALLITGGGALFTHRRTIVELAAKNRLPVMSSYKEATEIGGLMSYGSNRVDLFRRAAIYVGKILKGSKPEDLPIEQPIKYELVINLKTARTLKLEIPRDVLLIADEVIE